LTRPDKSSIFLSLALLGIEYWEYDLTHHTFHVFPPPPLLRLLSSPLISLRSPLQIISFFSIPLMIFDHLLISAQPNQQQQTMKLFGHERFVSSSFPSLTPDSAGLLLSRISNELKEILSGAKENSQFEISTNSAPQSTSIPSLSAAAAPGAALVTFVDNQSEIIVFYSQGRYRLSQVDLCIEGNLK
jgi:hypothetical protein